MSIANTEYCELDAVVSRLLGVSLTSAKRIGGGRNSQTFKAVCQNARTYALKHYFRHPTDTRDRLEVEFSGLKFLWGNGERHIPEPVVADREHQWAAYRWIDGERIPQDRVTGPQIDQAVEFLARLHELSGERASSQLPTASEACFSVQEVLDNIGMRLNKLKSSANTLGKSSYLQSFLASEFEPLLSLTTEWCKFQYAELRRSYTSELPISDRTLSPSDFGFHNALRRNDGQIVFLDFEYFGWDDPAKTISDFLLHPAMDLTQEHGQRFVDGFLSQFQEPGDLKARVKALHPLFGLKWCLILLNEFLPEHLLRRDFASTKEHSTRRVQTMQLNKAKKMLSKVREEYEYSANHG